MGGVIMSTDNPGYEESVAQLVELFQLARPPIGVAFVTEPPAGVAGFDGAVPSACSFWRHAESGVFYATAEQHANCLLGAMTMGFPLTEAQMGEIGGLVEQMCGCGYITGDEPAHLPAVRSDKNGIVYGPLAEFPITADVVLLWLTPRQAMIFQEASEAARWSSAGPSGRILGRPGCAALPVSLDSTKPILSFGCAGMRTFTEISDELVLGAISGGELTRFISGLVTTVQANQVMQSYYDGRKRQVAASAGD
jgi:uncharacterized protein (DUF169 family)